MHVTRLYGLVTVLLVACGSDPAAPDTTPDATVADTAVDATVDDTAPDAADSAPDSSDSAADTTADSADAVPLEDVVIGACSTDTPAGLAGCVERANYEADLAAFAVPRAVGTAAWDAARTRCADRLEALGYTVELHHYGVGTNVIGTRPGTKNPSERVLVGAHFDGVPECAAADDNASGVAGLLEVARVLALGSHDRTLVVACWDEEERGLFGSVAAAVRMSRARERIIAYFNFEMIGYFSDAPNSQTFPTGFELIFADSAAIVNANDNRGDFITNIGGDDARTAMRALDKYGRALGLPTITLELNAQMRASPLLADLRRSDHAAFWNEGYPAIMITDTSNFRYKAYHCGDGEDLVANLDPVRATKVVAATVGAAAEALQAGDPEAGSDGRARACDIATPSCSGAASKCTVGEGGFGIYQTTCMTPVEPTVAKGAVCERPTGVVGVDNCAPGLFCSFFGTAQSEPQVRHCLSICTGSSMCDEGEQCVRWHGGVSDIGLCVPTCDPFAADACGPGLGCMYEWMSFDDGTFVPSCDWQGAVPAEGSCESDDCAAGLACVFDTDTGRQVCRALCDAEHDCAAGTCTPYPNTGPADLGTCVP